MPHVDLLYAKLQNRDIDSVHIKGCIQQFQQDIQKIGNSLHSMVEQSSDSHPPSTEEFKACCGAVDLFQLFKENNLEEVFSETVALLKILITTPMTTVEAERCFSTLKRIQTFLRNTMTQERLNALAMLSMEKSLVTEMTDFNQKVIDSLQARRNGGQNVCSNRGQCFGNITVCCL